MVAGLPAVAAVEAVSEAAVAALPSWEVVAGPPHYGGGGRPRGRHHGGGGVYYGGGYPFGYGGFGYPYGYSSYYTTMADAMWFAAR